MEVAADGSQVREQHLQLGSNSALRERCSHRAAFASRTVHSPTAPDIFELEMKWKLGTPIGVLKVSLGNFTRMDEHLVVLLHTLGDVVSAHRLEPASD